MCHSAARPSAEGLGVAGRGQASLRWARRGKARHCKGSNALISLRGSARRGRARLGTALLGMALRGKARRSKAAHGAAGRGQ